MKKLTEKQKQKITKLISKGKRQYVLKIGVLYWGVMSAILFRFYMIVIHGTGEPFLQQFFSLETVIAFIIFPLCGIIFGLLMWKSLQKTAKNIL